MLEQPEQGESTQAAAGLMEEVSAAEMCLGLAVPGSRGRHLGWTLRRVIEPVLSYYRFRNRSSEACRPDSANATQWWALSIGLRSTPIECAVQRK